jgi:hypothetical protein
LALDRLFGRITQGDALGWDSTATLALICKTILAKMRMLLT